MNPIKSKGKWIHESNRNIKRITAWSVNVVCMMKHLFQYQPKKD
jgi:hypothetical protein